MDKERAFNNPADVFDHPESVLEAQALSDQEKERILQQWAQDIKELLTATEENMGSDLNGDPADMLRAVNQSLAQLISTRKTPRP